MANIERIIAGLNKGYEQTGLWGPIKDELVEKLPRYKKLPKKERLDFYAKLQRCLFTIYYFVELFDDSGVMAEAKVEAVKLLQDN